MIIIIGLFSCLPTFPCPFRQSLLFLKLYDLKMLEIVNHKLWFHNEFVSKSSYALWVRQNYATTGMCLFQLDSWLPIVWITPLIWGLLIRKVVVLWKAGMIRKWFRASPYRWSSPFTTKRTNLSYRYKRTQRGCWETERAVKNSEWSWLHALPGEWHYPEAWQEIPPWLQCAAHR